MDASAFNRIGRALDVLVVLLAICIPLGVWKIVDIIIWLCKNVSINIGN